MKLNRNIAGLAAVGLAGGVMGLILSRICRQLDRLREATRLEAAIATMENEGGIVLD